MKTNKSKVLTQVKGGYALAGLNFESVGTFVFMNIYKPKAIPSDICQRCLEELTYELGKLEMSKIQHQIPLEIYTIKRHKCVLKVVYYNECKRLFEKGQAQ